MNMTSSSLLALLLIASTAAAVFGAQQDAAAVCGRRKQARIIGGWAPLVNEYPMMAGLVRTGLDQVFCSGTIVSTHLILTAAHCVDTFKAGNVQVLVGAHDYYEQDKTKWAKLYDVDQFIIHPKYNGTKGVHDLAMVRTKKEIQYNAAVGPVCLPSGKEQLDTKWVAGLGWGALWKPNQGGQLSTELQTSALYVISNEVCRKLYGSFIADTHICTFTDEADFCSHDAGGPLYYEEKMYGGVKLVGVMSFGGCLNGKPNGSMRVYKYLPWINQLITKN